MHRHAFQRRDDMTCTCSGRQEEPDTLHTFGKGRSKRKPEFDNPFGEVAE